MSESFCRRLDPSKLVTAQVVYYECNALYPQDVELDRSKMFELDRAGGVHAASQSTQGW